MAGGKHRGSGARTYTGDDPYYDIGAEKGMRLTTWDGARVLGVIEVDSEGSMVFSTENASAVMTLKEDGSVVFGGVNAGFIVDYLQAKTSANGLLLKNSNGVTVFSIGVGGSLNASVAGDLDVAGDITVGGTVDGRDVAADGTALDGAVLDIGNNATAIGNNATAIGNNATAIGNNTTAIGNNTTAINTNAGNIANKVSKTETADQAILSNLGTSEEKQLLSGEASMFGVGGATQASFQSYNVNRDGAINRYRRTGTAMLLRLSSNGQLEMLIAPLGNIGDVISWTSTRPISLAATGLLIHGVRALTNDTGVRKDSATTQEMLGSLEVPSYKEFRSGTASVQGISNAGYFMFNAAHVSSLTYAFKENGYAQVIAMSVDGLFKVWKSTVSGTTGDVIVWNATPSLELTDDDLLIHGSSVMNDKAEEVSSRSTTGTWSITGLEIGKPVHLQLAYQNDGNAQEFAYRIVSGVERPDLSTGATATHSLGMNSDYRSAGTATLIPTSTTIVIEVEYVGTNAPITYAYQ